MSHTRTSTPKRSEGTDSMFQVLSNKIKQYVQFSRQSIHLTDGIPCLIFWIGRSETVDR